MKSIKQNLHVTNQLMRRPAIEKRASISATSADKGFKWK